MPEDVSFEAKGSAVGACGREAEVKERTSVPGYLARNQSGMRALWPLAFWVMDPPRVAMRISSPVRPWPRAPEAGPTQVNPERELLWLDAGRGLAKRARRESRATG